MNSFILPVDPHPLLDLRAFTATFPRPLGEMAAPPTLLELLRADATAPMGADDAVRESVRALLRHGGFKPTGRSKPASEYLLKAVREGHLSPINLAVDACNAVSLHSGLPISVVDARPASRARNRSSRGRRALPGRPTSSTRRDRASTSGGCCVCSTRMALVPTPSRTPSEPRPLRVPRECWGCCGERWPCPAVRNRPRSGIVNCSSRPALLSSFSDNRRQLSGSSRRPPLGRLSSRVSRPIPVRFRRPVPLPVAGRLSAQT